MKFPCGNRSTLTIAPILGRNARGFRSSVARTACLRRISCSMLFSQLTQLQSPLQYSPLPKHSQYNLRHREFLQLHCVCCCK